MWRDLDVVATTPVDWKFEMDRSRANFIGLGYRFADGWRAEAEGGLRQANYTAIGGATTAPQGVCSVRPGTAAAPGCDDPAGGTDVYSLMASAIRDFGAADARFRPYIGLGIGPVLYATDFGGRMNGIGSNASGTGTVGSPYNYVHGDSVKWSFGWQAQAGLAYQFSDRARVDLGYRYFDVPKVRWTADTYPAGRVRVDDDFEGHYRNQSLALGLQWAF